MISTKQAVRAVTQFVNMQKNNDLTTAELHDAESKVPMLGRVKQQFQTMVNMAKDVYAGEFKVSKAHMAILVGAIVYVLTPVDAVPDFLPIIGWLDDIGIVSLAISTLGSIMEEYVRYKNGI
ncbi:YkvA family protein [Algivirga pacifica]|uniref:YkvA family protein n=1 Tax=Algivirga pacifica TaxID=1162670 RepID=A0ABP9DPS1_9BACT